MSIFRIVSMLRRTQHNRVIDDIAEAERELRADTAQPHWSQLVHMEPPAGVSLAETLAAMDARHNDAVRRLVLAIVALAFVTVGSLAIAVLALTRPSPTAEQVERP